MWWWAARFLLLYFSFPHCWPVCILLSEIYGTHLVSTRQLKLLGEINKLFFMFVLDNLVLLIDRDSPPSSGDWLFETQKWSRYLQTDKGTYLELLAIASKWTAKNKRSFTGWQSRSSFADQCSPPKPSRSVHKQLNRFRQAPDFRSCSTGIRISSVRN